MVKKRKKVFLVGDLKDLLNCIEFLLLDKPKPLSSRLSEEYKNSEDLPFILLISCLLSLRTRDAVTIKACEQLFTRATKPEGLVKLSLEEIEKIIHSLGFFRKKARTILQVSNILINDFAGKVPKTERELLSLPGVGRKTANLVLAEAFGVPAIAVDTHVHRLSNLFGLVSTKSPEGTEEALKKIVPKSEWIRLHRLFVSCGQNKCEKYILSQ